MFCSGFIYLTKLRQRADPRQAKLLQSEGRIARMRCEDTSAKHRQDDGTNSAVRRKSGREASTGNAAQDKPRPRKRKVLLTPKHIQIIFKIHLNVSANEQTINKKYVV